jgi:hypothetical protein
MALSVNQLPPIANLSQSPIIYSIKESGNVITSSSFQYMLDLYFWTGSKTASGSTPDYTLVKYPNNSNAGIFDCSRILNSELNKLAEESGDNAKWFAADVYFQYQSGSVFVASDKYRQRTSIALDGYNIFPENINNDLPFRTDYWPILSSGPSTQQVFRDQLTLAKDIYVGEAGNTIEGQPKFAQITFSDGSQKVNTFGAISSGSSDTQYYITSHSPYDIVTSSLVDWYEIRYLNYTGGLMGEPTRYEFVCEQQYPNVQLKWKNRYGGFDWFNFNMVNRETFGVNRSQYQPQIGSWNSTDLGYERYESSILNYLVDTNQTLQVNTDWISQDYNDIFKQLLVSDEIYWVYDPLQNYVLGTGLRPITIKTNNIQFKTGVNDKLIQYSFDFDYGQGYKLIL